MKIAIMGAMVEEIEPLLEYFKDYETIDYAKNKFYKIAYKNSEIVIAYSKIGKVFATLTAATMIEKFECQKLLFSGVAGAINPSLKIGDLIVGDKLCQHDLDITAFGHPYGYVPEGAVCIDSDKDLKSIAFEVAKEKNIELKSGIIATGDQFIADQKRKEWIKGVFEADALEMEGAAVAVVCDALDIPFFILRAISDAADMDASFDFDEFLKSSAKVSAEFIISMVDKIIEADVGNSK
ncbi:MAG: 5'-methylthioadenosine/adenosylhomocysteine nucleosidase [Epsilonproteobacteria bacterium]|nr:5'-methylthioadenosine/adenosylhomocysteine nucleosidase [Campylobacterota bacterium]